MDNTVLFKQITLNWQMLSKEEVDIQSQLEEPPLKQKQGIYQVYGDSYLYGKNVLIYIGHATCLLNRLAQHKRESEYIGRHPNISFRIAIIEDENLKAIEQILIAMTKPSFNSASVKNISASAKDRYVYIQNHGERGDLPLEVTNYYFVNKDALAKEENFGYE